MSIHMVSLPAPGGTARSNAFMSALRARLDDFVILNQEPSAAIGEDSLAEALLFANRTASNACTRHGADPAARWELNE